MSKIVLTKEQIKKLVTFTEGDGHSSYTLTYATIPAQDGIVEYSGLVVISCAEEGGVLALES